MGFPKSSEIKGNIPSATTAEKIDSTEAFPSDMDSCKQIDRLPSQGILPQQLREYLLQGGSLSSRDIRNICEGDPHGD